MSKDGVQVFEGNGLSEGPRPPEIDWSGYVADDELPGGPRFAWIKDKLIDREDENRDIGLVFAEKPQGSTRFHWRFEIEQKDHRMPKVASEFFEQKFVCMEAGIKIAEKLYQGNP